MTLLKTNLKLKKIEKKLKTEKKSKGLFTFCFRTLHGGKQLFKRFVDVGGPIVIF
jgi:hypothetical protein